MLSLEEYKKRPNSKDFFKRGKVSDVNAQFAISEAHYLMRPRSLPCCGINLRPGTSQNSNLAKNLP
jgi:hypothetical protein